MLAKKKIGSSLFNLMLLSLVLLLLSGGAYADESVEQRLTQVEKKLSILEDGFEYSGYARAGYTMSINGGAANSNFDSGFGLGHFRLGNEVDTYVEQTFSKKWTKENGSWMRAQFLLTNQNHGDSTWETDGATGLLSNAYVEAGNLSYLPEGSSIWVGQRFYGRDDIHIIDFKWRAMDGYGAGIENLKTDLGTFDIAFIGRGHDSDVRYDLGEISQQNIDIRLKGVKVLNGTMDFAVTPSWAKDNDYDEYGLGLAAVYNKGDFYNLLPGFSKFAIQYGNRLGASLGGPDGTWLDTDDPQSIRLLTYGVGNISDKTQIMPEFIYQMDDRDDNDINTISVGARLEHFYNDTFAMQYEYGFEYQDQDAWDDAQTINKFTVAPTITWESDFWSRPQLRAFVTYASASDDVDLDGGSAEYKAGESGMTYGFQTELWW